MFYGFLALGLKVFLGAVMHEDARRRIIEGSDRVDGLRPSTRQNHQTSLEDAACDGNVNGD
ncbi:hypothetical protein LK07_24195 [Streptomyces pluripotens]|uniref:Uncharacterized protein n=1 Tax=Streptomyces pluripotens TaxID=1355015 RepID=A0A221P2W1_9ACTN|nr:hypothetical protein [Streptomyces pluripotens]ARP72348.1 hypothetical protein LK06_023030 [Streptomyces pluripotens]ASN26599.1 hypothetical protein LK07_24195 [Streptomyces pluripotens]